MSKAIEASIVVVDDEPSIRDLLVASLHFSGFEVNTAASGSEAIEVIEKVHPDLIVLSGRGRRPNSCDSSTYPRAGGRRSDYPRG